MTGTPRTLLPHAEIEPDWDALFADEAALRAGVLAIACRHRVALAANAPRRYDSGSLPVYALSEIHVLKLYPPHEREHAEVEARVLGAVEGRLPIATPRVLAVGEQDGWPYLLMSRLPGRRLVEAWPTLAARDRDRITGETGAALAALHALDIEPVATLPPDWNSFVVAQRHSAVQRQRERRLAPHWLAQIDPYLDRWMPPAPARRVLLHTEVMREHLMIEARAAGGLCVSGLFDFEPAMIGDPDYEFASFGLFVSCGDARLLRRALLAYGRRTDELDDGLACRFMAHALLHRYSNLRWYLERVPVPGATTLEELARAWWSAAT
jgi:hygromycin-B 7''-O-kinase